MCKGGLESQPAISSRNRGLRVATAGYESQQVVSAHHGLVTSRNGTRNHGCGSCCCWCEVSSRN
ncbi:hypothetical protein HanLR1_Chr14g0532091 [Helianthus annuus]|nr:hypothetical protein HanHA89_Chr14g0569701 [Helianthus annuus]KAJ0656111.1 hypothetical protein HanLR1_Chr14g0532091 [Helianthus annuus]